VQLVDQAGGEQMVPEEVTAEHQDLPTRTLFECSDLRACASARRTTRVGPHPPTASGFRLFETTTFWMALLRREISRSTAGWLMSSAIAGQPHTTSPVGGTGYSDREDVSAPINTFVRYS
jgi:hypothetical protein